MTNRLTESAVEKSSYAVTLSGWTDAVGTTVTPDTLTWTLTTTSGAVINSRSAVSATPAASVIILLSGLDLAFQTGEATTADVVRVLTIEGTYTSSLGSAIPLKEEYRFLLMPLVVVA
jgi:hypothetical protein